MSRLIMCMQVARDQRALVYKGQSLALQSQSENRLRDLPPEALGGAEAPPFWARPSNYFLRDLENLTVSALRKISVALDLVIFTV